MYYYVMAGNIHLDRLFNEKYNICWVVTRTRTECNYQTNLAANVCACRVSCDANLMLVADIK